MLFWLAPILIATIVALLLLRALRTSREDGLSAVESDIAVYRDQLKEVDRDLARGVLTEAEAEAVRTEVSRRLLEADRRGAKRSAASDGRVLPAAAIVVAALLAGSFLLYARVGAPGLADLPMTERLENLDAAARARPSQAEAEEQAREFLPEAPPADQNFLILMDQLRAALADRPDDVQGLTLLAENEARLGNFTAAREAQERLIAAYGEDVPIEERVALLELMVFTAGGFVSPEAEAVLSAILEAEPGHEVGLYYAGLLFSQNGRPDRAFPIWRRLLETSAPDAPWMPVLRAEIENVAAAAGVNYSLPDQRGPTAADMAAAGDMTAEERQDMIRGMVEGLAERLATDGGPPEDWARLIGALGVLGETARARAVADEALAVFAGNSDALATINAARARIGE
ncbi:c-type cytochrome biogenesis protein CcmI [Silicimonas sp. MF1-12-2]|uniref:c-type cytochrome biogenesis protein CcmI n=1 Tax=Silicimonas sp. MF1-12-2 TaxID=3384793 RepID=UPI0039B4BE02